MPKNKDFIIKQDENGYTYYIVLDGKVEVLINFDKTLTFKLSDLFKHVVKQYELIIENDDKQLILKELKHYFPKFIIAALTPQGEKYEIRDLLKAQEYIDRSKSLPEYIVTGKNGVKEIGEKEFKMKIMTKVADLGAGVGFGEIALLTNNPKRNASIRATSECHFAILHKKEFESTIGLMKRKKIKHKIDFLNTFSYISPLSNDRKTKLASLMTEKFFTFGQSVYVEGDKDEDIYFIKKGEFEMTKDIYIQQNSGRLGFRRMVIQMQSPYLEKLINMKNQVFVTTDENELAVLKKKYKSSVKNTTRM